jgi:hypothetical protein
MMITVFAIVGAFFISLIILFVFTVLARLFIAVLADVLVLIWQSFNQLSKHNRNTSQKGQNEGYKFHPVHYIIYSFQFLNSPLCLFCNWLQKLKIINQQCSNQNKEAREENPVDVSPQATSHISNLTQGQSNGQPHANRTLIPRFYSCHRVIQSL